MRCGGKGLFLNGSPATVDAHLVHENIIEQSSYFSRMLYASVRDKVF